MEDLTITKHLTRKISRHWLLKKNHPIVVENCRWANDFEADVVTVNKNDYVTEFEIKISRSDFKADFKKKDKKHYFLANGGSYTSPNYFYFVTPPGLLKDFNVPEKYGWITINSDGDITVEKTAKIIHKQKVKSEFVVKMLKVVSERLLLGSSKLAYINENGNE